MALNVRMLCLETLYEIHEKGVFCDAAIHKCIESVAEMDSRDRSFFVTLTEGIEERRIELDYLIGKYSSKPVEKLKPYIRDILRMAVYQIKYMNQVPDSAAVNEAVKLTAKKGYSGLRGYVNGVLRNMLRTLSQVDFPDAKKEPIKHISVKYSVPEWLVEHYLNELGEDAATEAMEYFLSKPDTVIRCTGREMNTDELRYNLSEQGISVTDGKIFDYALHLKKTGIISSLPGYSEGSFVVQDESSMIPAHIAAEYVERFLLEYVNEISSGARHINVLDMCAAPGGKTLQLAETPAGKVSVEARDISDIKLSKITQNAKRLRLKNVSVKRADAMMLDEDCVDRFDVVIADLPCSGLGVIGKKPDIKYNASVDGMAQLAAMQLAMLDNASRYVVRGGIIVYSTCTINRGENEDNANKFLEEHTNYIQVKVHDLIPDTLSEAVNGSGYIKILPGKYPADGFFVAVFKRI